MALEPNSWLLIFIHTLSRGGYRPYSMVLPPPFLSDQCFEKKPGAEKNFWAPI